MPTRRVIDTSMDNEFMNREAVQRWLELYEQIWRTPGTARLHELFVSTARYLPSPWARPHRGLDEIARFWESERDGADEEFTLSSDVVAVDRDTAVVVAVLAGSAGRTLATLGWQQTQALSSAA